MSLEPCKNCQNEISHRAETCPYCGDPIKNIRDKKQQEKAARNRLIFMVVFVVLFFIAFQTGFTTYLIELFGKELIKFISPK